MTAGPRPERQEPALGAPALNGNRVTSATEIGNKRSNRAGSLAYKVAGVASRSAIELVVVSRLSALDLRVFLAVLHRTVTYSKATDLTSTRDLASIVYGIAHGDVCGWQRRNVSASLRRLAASGAITYETGRGRSSRCRVAIPVRGKGVSDGALSVNERDANQLETGSDLAPKVIEIAATPSNQSEESSEAPTDIERIILAVVAKLARDTRAWVRDQARNVDRAALARVISTHPGAPVDSLAGWVLNEPNSLNLYRSAS